MTVSEADLLAALRANPFLQVLRTIIGNGVARVYFCPPRTPPACATQLADDTHAPERHPCAGGLSAVPHT